MTPYLPDRDTYVLECARILNHFSLQELQSSPLVPQVASPLDVKPYISRCFDICWLIQVMRDVVLEV
jgi:hypothetical protein